MNTRTLIRGQATMNDVRDALDALGVQHGQPFTLASLGGEARARRGDPDTSREAAASVTDLRQKQKAVLNVFERVSLPLTDERLVKIYEDMAARQIVPEQSPSGIRSRRDELVKAGFLIDTGEKERLESGRHAILWGIPVAPEPEQPTMFDVPPVPTSSARSAIAGLD